MKKEQVVLVVVLTLSGGLMVCTVCAGLVTAYFASQYQGTQAPGTLTMVWVAAIDLPNGTVIDQPETQLMLKTFYPDTVPADASGDVEDLRGKVLKRPVERFVPLCKSDLQEKPALQIPSGY